MIHHIIFFTYLPLSEKIETDFYLKVLGDNGYKVTYADVSRITGKNAPHAVQRSYLLEIPTWESFSNLLKANEGKDCIFLTNMTYNHETYKLFSFMNKYDVRIGFFARGTIPVPGMMESLAKRMLKNPFAYFSIGKGLRFLKNKVAARAKIKGRVRPYDVLFLAGNNGVRTIGLGWDIDLRHAKIVHMNYFDYDQYLALGNQHSKLVPEPYAVFIDQYLPYHPDFKMFNIGTVAPEEYFREMNFFFENLEQTYGLKVVIAAHPKAEYTVNPFNGRRLIKYETAALIRDAELVLTHYSTAISFCALYRKPVYMLYSDTIRQVCSRYMVQFMCDSIGGMFYDMDKAPSLALFKTLKIDDGKYDRYKYDYLTSKESEQQQSVVLFLDALKTL